MIEYDFVESAVTRHYNNVINEKTGRKYSGFILLTVLLSFIKYKSDFKLYKC